MKLYRLEPTVVARDEEFRERLVVSQRFVDLCHRTGLNVSFADPL